MKIKVWKDQTSGWGEFRNMWKGTCSCGKKWQYWAFGATLGYGLEHLRRHR